MVSGRRSSRSSGQSTVEFVLITPFFALMLLTLVQVGLLVRTRLLVTHAAGEAARFAAVGASDFEVRDAALSAANLESDRLAVTVQRWDGLATVELRYVAPTDVPLVGALVQDATFSADATMRLE